MGYEYSENDAMVYETLRNIEDSVTTLLERTMQVRTANDVTMEYGET